MALRMGVVVGRSIIDVHAGSCIIWRDAEVVP